MKWTYEAFCPLWMSNWIESMGIEQGIDGADWVQRFHRGDRLILEQLYRDYFDLVERAVGEILSGADKETVIHEVFFRLISDARVRGNFQGGSLNAWLKTVSRNQSIDFQRRHKRECSIDAMKVSEWQRVDSDNQEANLAAKSLVDRFCKEQLPSKWQKVFQARFIEQLSQREAAKKLGVHRTTLAYQEQRIRKLLRRFVLRQEGK